MECPFPDTIKKKGGVILVLFKLIIAFQNQFEKYRKWNQSLYGIDFGTLLESVVINLGSIKINSLIKKKKERKTSLRLSRNFPILVESNGLLCNPHTPYPIWSFLHFFTKIYNFFVFLFCVFCSFFWIFVKFA